MRRTRNIPEVMRMARERDIIVNAVQAGGARDTERVWREIAQMRRRPLHPDPAGRRPDRGHRDALRPRDHRAAGPHQRHGHSLRPARAALAASSRRPGRSPRRRASVASDMAGYHEQAARRGASAKRSPARGDLVADVDAGRQKLDGGQGRRAARRRCARMKPAERQAAIDKQMAERKALNERMAELVKKRDALRRASSARKRRPSPPTRSTARSRRR